MEFRHLNKSYDVCGTKPARLTLSETPQPENRRAMFGSERLSVSLIVSSDFRLAPELNPVSHFHGVITILMIGCFA